MKITKNKFFWTLYLILIYELVMLIFKLDGFSIQKIIITSFLWIAVIFELVTLYKEYSEIRQSIPRIAFISFITLVLWNLYGIASSVIVGTEKISTLFGNINSSLMLLIPFSFVFAFNINNITIINTYLSRILTIGLIISILIITKSDLFVINQGIMNFIVLAVLLLTQIPFLNKRKRFYVLFVSILVFLDALLLGSRAMMIRIPLLIICLVVLLIYRKTKIRSILYLSFIIVFIPFYFLKESISSNTSILSKYSDESSFTKDNRTFLYTEVFEDLISSNTIIQGKGASGTYFSKTMHYAKADSENRPSVEVGILAILLKGGLIAVLLTSFLLILAIYMSFFKSQNIFIIGVGYLLLVHFIILFVENLVQYNSYNFLIWFFIGICLNKEVRQMTNQEIKNLIRYGVLS